MMNPIRSNLPVPSSPTPSILSSSDHSSSHKPSIPSRHTSSPTKPNQFSLDYLSQKPNPIRTRIPICDIISLFNSNASTTTTSTTSLPLNSLNQIMTPSLSISSGSSDSSSGYSGSIKSMISQTSSPHSTPCRSNTPSLHHEPGYELDMNEDLISTSFFNKPREKEQEKEGLKAWTDPGHGSRRVPYTFTNLNSSEPDFFQCLGTEGGAGGIRKRSTSTLGLTPPRLPPRPLSFSFSKPRSPLLPPPLPPRKLGTDWKLKEVEKKKESLGIDRKRKVVESVWESVQIDGSVLGILVRKIWLGCGLGLETLAQIWDLVVKGDSSVKELDYDQFVLGFQLIDQFLIKNQNQLQNQSISQNQFQKQFQNRLQNQKQKY
ncbi:uncharacterized protein MELLADRAFT_118523 [Melampsora larici-populina 98AG31]|uniref:EH domain-containing protein n=1 Tax=Melampsora larici-populina (strain 98AG31 / pathotype 3-4-7) TaxID=747676 RepID=F4SA40_MELLP|nr:uncharacterized protein MELLADRAFT_118523 [Melampsora larici-populina 98AG31]EGF98506.1 hypothetical protein MELLADRAFT_118523 [Melampsora larici-populina 98AG31]